MSIQDSQGCIPLHLAAWTGQADICSTLLTTEDIYQVNAQVFYYVSAVVLPLTLLAALGHHRHVFVVVNPLNIPWGGT